MVSVKCRGFNEENSNPRDAIPEAVVDAAVAGVCTEVAVRVCRAGSWGGWAWRLVGGLGATGCNSKAHLGVLEATG